MLCFAVKDSLTSILNTITKQLLKIVPVALCGAARLNRW